ncbi:hypothetical protein OAO65_02130 [Flavobacteriales bacterium]|nr:hypothetical protein [Flavobacteriales bacterium]
MPIIHFQVEYAMSTTTIKSGEALSNGHIFDKKAKKKEQQTVQQQIDAFFKAGGKVTKA